MPNDTPRMVREYRDCIMVLYLPFTSSMGTMKITFGNMAIPWQYHVPSGTLYTRWDYLFILFSYPFLLIQVSFRVCVRMYACVG